MFNLLSKRGLLLIATMLLAQIMSADYVISVYKDGGGFEKKFSFADVGEGSRYRATCEITSYTGKTSDYKFWIGKDGWEDGRSKNEKLSDFLSSCSSGVFTIDIDYHSGSENYYPNNAKCKSCVISIPAAGVAIPANTEIYFDNTNTMWSAVYASVPNTSLNANSTSVDQGSYVPKNDVFYSMSKVEGTNLWRCVITGASTFGRISFWSTSQQANNDVYKTKVCLNTSFNGTNNMYIPQADYCSADSRQTQIYQVGSWSSRAGLVLSTSSNECIPGTTTSITLNALKSGSLSGFSYKWMMSKDNGVTYTTLSTTTTPSLVLSGATLPTQTTVYQVICGEVKSNSVKVTYINLCDDASKTSKNIFKEDFGTLPSLKGADSRDSYSYIHSSYVPCAWPYKVNDGLYSVVSTSYYCGCGNGDGGSVVDCEGNNMWFRSDLRDHTMKNMSTTGPFGAMLLLNFSTNAADSIAMIRELTTEETKFFVEGASIVFSAWFAYPAPKSHLEGGSEVMNLPVNMALIIQQYKGSKWVNVSKVVSTVGFDDGWMRGTAEFDITSSGGKYRLLIINNAKGGTGNDVLIDDISLDLCVPNFNIELYDSEKGAHERETVSNTEQDLLARVKYDSNWGLGESPQLLVFEVDTTKVNGESGKYKYTGIKMTRSGDYYTYDFKASDYLKDVPDTVHLSAVVISASDDAATIASKIELGEIYANMSVNYLFSGSYITFEIGCNDLITFATVDGKSVVTVCETGVGLPILRTTFAKVTGGNVSYVLKEDGNVVKSGTAATSPLDIDLSTLSLDMSVKTHNFTIELHETFKGNDVCERVASQPIVATVVSKPSVKDLITSYNVCRGFTTEMAITATGATEYQWVWNKNGVWTDIIGATTARYETSDTITVDKQYRVKINSEYCGSINSDIINLKVDVCEDVHIDVEIDKSSYIGTSSNVNHYCGNDTVSITISAINDASYPTQTNVKLGSSPELKQISVKPSLAVIEANVWKCGMIPAGGKVSITRTFVITKSGAITLVDSAYVSKMGSETYTGYNDVNLKETMKNKTTIVVDSKTDTPVGITANPVYDECPIAGSKSLASMIVSNQDELTWYAKDGTLLGFTSFDTNTPIDTMVYVTNRQSGGYCISDTANLQIRVREKSAKLTTKDLTEQCPIESNSVELISLITSSDYGTLSWFDEKGDPISENPIVDMSIENLDKTYYVIQQKSGECKSDEKASIKISVLGRAQKSDIEVEPDNFVCKGSAAQIEASSSTVSNGIFKWYSDENLTNLIYTGASYTVSNLTEPTSLYITVENEDFCQNGLGNAQVTSVGIKEPISKVSLTPEEETIGLGSLSNKKLEIEPASAVYEVAWTANGIEFDPSTLPHKPYKDQVYKVVVKDECNNTYEVEAKTYVLWPTVITPYNNDGYNDDFVVGMDEPFAITVLDRYGDRVYEGPDGWTQEAAKNKMPGVYYYIVTLPDGTYKKGAIEIYK